MPVLLAIVAIVLLPAYLSATPGPFSWEALGNVEGASPAVVERKEGPSRPVIVESSHRLLSERVDSSSVCTTTFIAGPASSILLLSVLLAVATTFFLFGWYCGAQQATSTYALRQATLEDQREQLAQEADAVEAEAVAGLSTALATLQPLSRGEVQPDSTADAISSSADSKFEIVQNNQEDAADSATDNQSSSTSTARPSQSIIEEGTQHASTTAVSNSNETAPQASDEASQAESGHPQHHLGGPQSLLQPPTDAPHSSQELAITNSASQIIDRILRQLDLRIEDLNMRDRVQLVPAVVQALGLVVHHHDHQEDHRLQGVANFQSAARNNIIQHGQADERAWRQSKEQHRQLQDFKLQIADCLMCGLILMLMGIVYFGSAFGFYEGRLSQCTTARHSVLASFWRPLKSFDMAACYISAISDLVGSFFIMLLGVYCIKRFALLTDSVATPMTSLLLFLGGGCGWLGKFVIGRLGGDSRTWVAGYEAWVLLQVCAIWCVQALHVYLQADNAASVVGHLRKPGYMLLMGVIVPVAVAACPFWANLIASV